jgi:hypothetical protein
MDTISGAGEWRALDGTLSAWYDAPSVTAGAALVARIAELSGATAAVDVDLRATGLRVRIAGPSLVGDGLVWAREISKAASELGLQADPATLQTIRFALASSEPALVERFWEQVLDYERVGAHGPGLHGPAAGESAAAGAAMGGLEDGLRREPGVRVERLEGTRPLRNRIHVDVGRSAAAVERVKAAIGKEAYGAYGLTLADHDGNEVDLVPGEELAETTDWLAQFGAMTFYPNASSAQASQLVTAVAELADGAGVPLMVDVRPEGVAIDSGKDLWERPDGGADPRFVEVARRIERAARSLGLVADPARLRFVQFGIDAVNVPAVRAFWMRLLKYEQDPRPFVSDIYDPRWLNPVLIFQELDAADEERRRQRNRIRFELVVPDDAVQSRLEAALSAGGRILAEEPGQVLVGDPEGNEVEVRSTGG